MSGLTGIIAIYPLLVSCNQGITNCFGPQGQIKVALTPRDVLN